MNGKCSGNRFKVEAVSHLFCNHFSRKVQKSGSRNLVREIWFEKSGSRKVVLKTRIFFSGSRKVVDQKKRWVYTINPPFFRLEKSGCRLNGQLEYTTKEKLTIELQLKLYEINSDEKQKKQKQNHKLFACFRITHCMIPRKKLNDNMI